MVANFVIPPLLTISRARPLCANLGEGEGRDGLVMGDTICFADITLVSGFIWMRVTLGSESEEWARIMSWKGARAKKTLEKFAQYEIVDL